MKYTNRILNHPIVVSGQFVYRSSLPSRHMISVGMYIVLNVVINLTSFEIKVKHIYSVRFTKIQQNKFNKAKKIC